MKKILAISFLAISAVTAANAEIASKAYVDALDTAMDTRMDTAEGNINRIDGDASTTGSFRKAIADLDVSELAQTNNFVKTITETDGKVSATFGQVTNADVASSAAIVTSKIGALDGYVGAATGDNITEISSSDTLNVALGRLQGQINSNGTDANTKIGDLDDLTTTDKDNLVEAINEVDNHADANATAIALLNDAVGVSGSVANSIQAKVLTLDGTVVANDIEGGNVVAEVTETDGVITVTHGKAISSVNNASGSGAFVVGVAIGSDGKSLDYTKGDPLAGYTQEGINQGAGKYALTAIVDGNNNITGYSWELIERPVAPAQQGEQSGNDNT